MFRFITLFALLALVGCDGQSGPPSVSQTSATTPALADRVAFVQQYVKFRRQYDQLDYAIFYQNNGGGMVPGPSDWDIRLVAKVPANEIDGWVSPDMTASSVPADAWHTKIETEIDVANVVTWHACGGRSVGIDRANSIVVYRNNTMGQ